VIKAANRKNQPTNQTNKSNFIGQSHHFVNGF